MEKDILIEVIRIIPSLVLYSILGILLWALYKPFVQQLLPKLANFKAFGVEIDFLKNELKVATVNYGLAFNDLKGQALLKRFARWDTARKVRVLWIDDTITSNKYELNILDSLGITSNFAHSSEEAREKLQQTQYDLVISDISRKDNPAEGVEFLAAYAPAHPAHPPFIFNIANFDKAKGTPPYAFGITNNPVDLFHLIMDILDRTAS